MTLTRDAYADAVLADAARFAEAVRTGPLDAPVAACPGWDLRALTAHLGHIHRWARLAVLTGENPMVAEFVRPAAAADADEWADWLSAGAQRLAATLRAVDPETPSWHPFRGERVAGLWPRRQAHETAIHRWDAQQAVGTPDPIAPELASDGIDEFFEIALPRALTRERAAAPSGSLHVHCTDTHGEWLVHFEGGNAGALHLVREHAKGDAALRGPAEQLLLALYHRPHDADALSPVGDPDVLAAWLGAPGL